jgi:hypothetical protein
MGEAATPVTPVTNELLDEMSGQGDPVADAVIEAHFAWLRARVEGHRDDVPGDLVRGMAAHLRLPPEGPGLSPYEEYLRRDDARLPEWATGPEADERLRRGAAFFEAHALQIGSALFCGSLPAGYASPRGARVLTLTGRLGDAPVRRIAETAQFLVDVMSVGGLQRGRPGYEDIQRVRTMHAAVRHFILHDPNVPRTRHHPPPADGWCDAWGTPINQEDLLGGLLTFTVTVFEVLDKLGVECDEADLDAYLFRWCVIGHLMGLRPDVLPLDRRAALAAAELIRARQCEPSRDGQELTQALVGAVQATMPRRIADGLVPATVRWYVGDDMADVLDVRRNLWSPVLQGPVARLSDVVNPDQRRLARLGAGVGALVALGYRRTMQRIGGAALEGFLEANRPGDGRPPFAVPTELRPKLPHGPRAFRLRRRSRA